MAALVIESMEGIYYANVPTATASHFTTWLQKLL